MSDVEDLPLATPLKMWYCASRINPSGPDCKSRVRLKRFETFEGGHSAKETRSVECEELVSSRRQCIISLSSPHSWVAHRVKNGIVSTPSLFAKYSTHWLPPLPQEENAAQKLSRSNANLRRSWTRFRKTTSRSDSKSGINAGTCLLLRKVTISKEFILKFR